MKLSKEMQKFMKQVEAIEDKYGLVVFRAALTHLVDVGYRNLNEDTLEDEIKQILEQGEIDKANGINPILTPEFKCAILRCSTELTEFTIWTLFTYIKKYIVVGT